MSGVGCQSREFRVDGFGFRTLGRSPPLDHHLITAKGGAAKQPPPLRSGGRGTDRRSPPPTGDGREGGREGGSSPYPAVHLPRGSRTPLCNTGVTCRWAQVAEKQARAEINQLLEEIEKFKLEISQLKATSVKPENRNPQCTKSPHCNPHNRHPESQPPVPTPQTLNPEPRAWGKRRARNSKPHTPDTKPPNPQAQTLISKP